MNYRFPIRFSNAEQKQLEAYAEKYNLTKGQVLKKGWNYYTDRTSTAKMLPPQLSEVRGWQNQEKTAEGYVLRTGEESEKRRSLFLFLYRFR